MQQVDCLIISATHTTHIQPQPATHTHTHDLKLICYDHTIVINYATLQRQIHLQNPPQPVNKYNSSSLEVTHATAPGPRCGDMDKLDSSRCLK